MPVKFDLTPEEERLVKAIGERAFQLLPRAEHVAANVAACHSNIERLRLAELLAAEPYAFAFEIRLIARAVSRELLASDFPREHLAFREAPAP